MAGEKWYKPDAPKTTRSYVRPWCLKPILKACSMAVEMYQTKYVRSVKMHKSVCLSGLLVYGSTELTELQTSHSTIYMDEF